MADAPSLAARLATVPSLVAASDHRADARRAALLADFAIPGASRPTDRERALVSALLRGSIRSIASEIVAAASYELDDAATLASEEAVERRAISALLTDGDMADALIAAARTAVIDEELALLRTPDRQPHLLATLLEHREPQVAERARDYLLAENTAWSPDLAGGAPLPAALHRRLCWTVAASLRAVASPSTQSRDRALANAATVVIRRHATRTEPLSAAVRLAQVLEPRADEAAVLLHDALAEARVTLFVALLARVIGLPADEVRAIVLDAEGELPWLALRALPIAREDAARIGFLLCEADPARDVEQLPDVLDTVWQVSPEQARAAVAPLSLHTDFRGAIRRIALREGGQ